MALSARRLAKRSNGRDWGGVMAFSVSARHLLILALTLSCPAAIAEAGPITSVVVYGDSLSDNGNLFAATGEPPAPYFQGRASNGPVAVEFLAASLGVPLVDFAWFGATTGLGNFSDLGTPTSLGAASLPGMQLVFSNTQASLTPFLDGLFVVWGGTNDLLSPSPLDATPQDIVGRAVSNLLGLVVALEGLGANNILVPGLPDVGLIPRTAAGGPAAVAQASAITDAFNLALQSNLPPGVLFFDSAALLRSAVANPSAFGFTNVTTPCFDGIAVCANPDQHLFWDQAHPTTAGHAVFARAFEQTVAVPEPSTFALLACGLAVWNAVRRRTRGRHRQ
jgi:cholinesterase